MNQPFIITIDGASCTGKGTLALNLAQKLEFNHLDSGLFYRAAAYVAVKNDWGIDDYGKIIQQMNKMRFVFSDSNLVVEESGTAVNGSLRSPLISERSSILAQHPVIRDEVTKKLRAVALEASGIVADGRDMGTFVFPQADCKFFLIASLAKRAQRRFEQLKVLHPNLTLKEVQTQLAQRDERDAQRLYSPLSKPEDAVVIDTSSASIDECMTEIISLVERSLLHK